MIKKSLLKISRNINYKCSQIISLKKTMIDSDDDARKDRDNDQPKSTLFYCGGILTKEETIDFSLFIKGKNSLVSLSFPNPPQKEIDEVIAQSSKATFGKGKKNVLDESYRKAYVIDGLNVGISLNCLGLFRSLDPLISNYLCPEINEIELKMYKFNIMEKDGFFNDHMDTPVQHSFGTLVIFLPSKFTVKINLKKNINIFREENYM